MKSIVLLLAICHASIEKWAIKHGVTFHPEKMRWKQVSFNNEIEKNFFLHFFIDLKVFHNELLNTGHG